MFFTWCLSFLGLLLQCMGWSSASASWWHRGLAVSLAGHSQEWLPRGMWDWQVLLPGGLAPRKPFPHSLAWSVRAGVALGFPEHCRDGRGLGTLFPYLYCEAAGVRPPCSPGSWWRRRRQWRHWGFRPTRTVLGPCVLPFSLFVLILAGRQGEAY